MDAILSMQKLLASKTDALRIISLVVGAFMLLGMGSIIMIVGGTT